MKKITAFFIIITLFLSLFSSSFAKTTSPASLKSIKYSKTKTQDQITINISSYKGWNAFYLSSPDRLVIDFPNSKTSVKGQKAISVKGLFVKSARYSQFSKSDTRVVLDLTGKSTYTVKQNSGSITFTLKKSGTNAGSSNSGGGSGSAGSSGSTAGRGGEPDRGDSAPQPVTYSYSGGIDTVTIASADYLGYNIMRLTGPDRIVIDVPKCIVPTDEQLITASNANVSAVRYAKSDNGGARIVIDTVGQPQYLVSEGTNQLTVTVQAPDYKNLTYTNNSSRTYFSISGVNLPVLGSGSSISGTVDGTSAEAADFNSLYSGVYDETGRKYTVTFPSGVLDIGSGTMKIHDGVVNTLEIVKDPATQTTRMNFFTAGKFIFGFGANSDTKTLEITLSRSYSPEDRLVVIDAGHGGQDTGATYNGMIEKDLNLKIALKVNEILKSKGVNTYLTRDDDTFVPLYDRANIANDMNATLFLSVHNNAYNKSEYGTETLSYPSAASRSFARTVQDSLINALGTKDRGLVDRPNLVVLHQTAMPAVIAEVAFITNDGDHAKLLDETFLQNAAQALADAVVTQLGK